MLSDEELLAFDRTRLADARRLDEQALLSEHGDLYRNHLATALWLEGWRGRLQERGHPGTDSARLIGEDYVLGEVVAHLRQGDFLPGGDFYEETVNPPTRGA